MGPAVQINIVEKQINTVGQGDPYARMYPTRVKEEVWIFAHSGF
jgi:hypothetical protein